MLYCENNSHSVECVKGSKLRQGLPSDRGWCHTSEGFIRSPALASAVDREGKCIFLLRNFLTWVRKLSEAPTMYARSQTQVRDGLGLSCSTTLPPATSSRKNAVSNSSRLRMETVTEELIMGNICIHCDVSLFMCQHPESANNFQ